VRRLGIDGTLVREGGSDVFVGPGVRWDDLRSPWRAPWQRTSIGAALLTLACVRGELPVDPAAVRRGLARAEWPGRLSVLPGTPRVVLDGAHNPAGARALASELPWLLAGRRARVLFACGRDRSWDAMVAAIAPFAREAVVTEVGRRPAPVREVAASFAGRGVPVRIEALAARALDGLLGGAADTPVLVTGSLFLVGAVLGALAPPLWPPWQGWGVDATEPPR
jgi:dihydrofolate synthase/folylpolyglutamate synthase